MICGRILAEIKVKKSLFPTNLQCFHVFSRHVPNGPSELMFFYSLPLFCLIFTFVWASLSFRWSRNEREERATKRLVEKIFWPQIMSRVNFGCFVRFKRFFLPKEDAQMLQIWEALMAILLEMQIRSENVYFACVLRNQMRNVKYHRDSVYHRRRW